ncbi:MAG: hypothetical protein PVF21_02145 [Thiohalophilus sp.]|jgi:hypothetical protein
MAISLPQRFRLKRLRPDVGGSSRRALDSLASRKPLVYRGLVTLFALAGYLLLALFPLIALSGLLGLPGQLQTIQGWQDGLWFGLNVLILLIAAALSIPLFQIRFASPKGMEINPQNAPKFSQEIEQLRQDFKNPGIHSVILSEGFGVHVVSTPRFRLPLLYRNTLVIGLESLLSLPPDQFRSLLARRVGQLSGMHHRFINWLARLRRIWPLYHQAFRLLHGPLSWPLRWLFALYAPFYSALSFYVARQDELEADRYALDIANDAELAGLFSQLIITETFLKHRFWPKITQLAQRSGTPEHLPYASLTAVLRRGMSRDDIQNWIKTAFETQSDTHNPAPLLRQRLENIGHNKPTPPRALHETAADHYFDSGVMQKIIAKFDQHWLARRK